MIDFRGQTIETGDVIIYVGRQGMKETLVEGRVIRTELISPFGPARCAVVKPLRSSSPLGQPTGKLVTLTIARKVVVLRKARIRKDGRRART